MVMYRDYSVCWHDTGTVSIMCIWHMHDGFPADHVHLCHLSLCCLCKAPAANGQNTARHLSSECVAKLTKTSHHTHGRLGVAKSHLIGWHVNAEWNTISTVCDTWLNLLTAAQASCNSLLLVSGCFWEQRQFKFFFLCISSMPNTR